MERTVMTPQKKATPTLAELRSKDSDKTGNPDGVTNSGKENVINKTPAELAAETPDESAARYGISDEIPDDVHNDPNVVYTRDNKNFQVASGTHLHPDVAKDNYNRSAGAPAEGGQVTRSITEVVYADEAELDDKGIKRDKSDEDSDDVD